MDKLKPILTHKFWILCGIALLLPIIGWFLGTGAVAAAIDARVATLSGLSVPDGSQIPNEDWMAKVKVVQNDRQKRLDTAGSYLWDEQQKYMAWPQVMRPFVKDQVFEADLGIDAEEAYRSIYNRELLNLVQIVDPYRINEMTFKEEGKVALDPAALVTLPPDASIWPTSPPSSKEVWYLQEEMWLIRGLLEAVRDVNDKAAADSIVKAPVKQIDLIQLQGGDMAALDAAATGAEGGAEGGTPGDAHSGSDMMSEMASRFGGMMGEGAAGGAPGVDFDLAEEVGPNTPAASADAAAGTEGETAVATPGDAHGGGGMPGLAGMMGGAGMPNPLLNEKRYVDDDKTAPFKTRAFKMQVVMDHRHLQEFLAELTNSPFPVRIVRVHWAELNPDPRFGGSASGVEGGMPGGGMGGRGGMPGGMGGRGGMAMPPGGIPGGFSGRMPGAAGGRGGMPGPMGGRGGLGAIPGGGRGGFGAMPGGARGGMPGPMGGRGGMPGPMGGARGGMPGPMGGRGGMPGPMGGRGGMPMPGRLGGNLPGMDYAGEGLAGDTGSVDLYTQAMMNPYLAQVVVGGVITIYRSPQETAAAATGGTDAAAADATATGAAATDAAATDATEAVPPAEGEAVAPSDTTTPGGAAPADGNAPAESAPADGAAPGASETAPAGDAAPTDPSAPAATTTTAPAEGTEPPAAATDGATAADSARTTPESPASP